MAMAFTQSFRKCVVIGFDQCFLVLVSPTTFSNVLSIFAHFVPKSLPICSLILLAVVFPTSFSDKSEIPRLTATMG